MGNIKNLSCGIITEGIAGTENQCLGVAEALGVQADVKRIALRQPWKSLSPYLGLEQAWSFDPALTGPPWPDLLITSGRKAIAASRYIKHVSGGRTFTTHIQDPRIDPRPFDLVAVPAHDPTRGENVVVTTAAPNRITPERLAAARGEFRQFGDLPGPRIGVLIGGTSKAYQFTTAQCSALAAQLQALDGSLMITTSRRTGAENEALLRESLDTDGHFFWDGQGANPYFGILAWADYLLVTADSTSMLSEACTTGTPVYMIPLAGGHKRINKLHQNLTDRGALRIFEGALEDFRYTPLNDAEMIARKIAEVF